MPNESLMKMLATEICSANSIADALLMYRTFAPFLTEYKFVFAAEKGGTPGFAVNRSFSAGAAVRSIFGSQNVFVLDSQTFADMNKHGAAEYPLDFSISLDTEAMSYLHPFIVGAYNKGIPDDFKEVFAFIAQDEVNVDPTPYMSENILKLDELKLADGVFKTLRSYEVLRTLDKKRLRSKGEVCSVLTNEEVNARALELISGMYRDRSNHAAMAGLQARHSYLYLCLMKMVEIQIKSPKRSTKNKLIEFITFCDEEVATLFARETAIAAAYFEKGHDLTFFGKMHKGQDLQKPLKNMAWDLCHVRQLEEGMTMLPVREARYFFTALLTFDKRLIEIIDLYPLRSFGFKVSGGEQITNYGGDLIENVFANELDRATVHERFLSSRALDSRSSRRDKVREELPDIVARMETALERWS